MTNRKMIMIIIKRTILFYFIGKKSLLSGFHISLVFMLLLSFKSSGQNDGIVHDFNFTLPGESGEQIEIFTDRTLYIVTENIHFTVNYSVNRDLNSLNWSNVLYVELIRWNGEKMVQSKFTLNKTGVAGYLQIPGDIYSGYYYIRAYTRWMRNYSNSDYGYSLVKIVNPFKQEIDPGPDKNNDLQYDVPEKMQAEKMVKGISCSTHKTVYRPREKVELNLLVDKEFSDNYHDYYISVVNAGCLDTSYLYPFSGAHESQTEGIKFLPEIRRASVSGYVTEGNTGQPLAGVEIYLSVPVGGEYFSVFNSGEQGEFFFTLPYLTGNYDFFIEVLADNSVEAKIRIDNDFCSVPVTLPYLLFELNAEEEKLVQKLMINRQLEEKFDFDSVEAAAKETASQVVFYGSPQTVIHVGEYIELNDLEEFIFELVPQVIVYHKKGKPYVRMEHETGLSYLEPLVLIDNLPVSNIELFLKTPLKKLDRIELINQEYIAGNKIFSGLVSIYSKDNDFAGFEMSKNSMFFNYNLYSDNTYNSPVYDGTSYRSRIPDRRNLLFWQPHVYLNSEETTGFSFYTSDDKGDYIVYVRSINDKNTPGIYGTCLFTVE